VIRRLAHTRQPTGAFCDVCEGSRGDNVMRRLVILALGFATLIRGGVGALRAQQSATQQPPEKAAPYIPSRVRAGGQVMAARKIHEVRPKYPREAREKHIQGTVRLEAIIRRDGRVSELKVLKGDPLLVDAATEAVRKWRYKPVTIRGQAVEVVTEIDVIFELR
jgi:TonB family protein